MELQDGAVADPSGLRRGAFVGAVSTANEVAHAEIGTQVAMATSPFRSSGIELRGSCPSRRSRLSGVAPNSRSRPLPQSPNPTGPAPTGPVLFGRGKGAVLCDGATRRRHGRHKRLHCGAFVGAVLTANEVMHGLQAGFRSSGVELRDSCSGRRLRSRGAVTQFAVKTAPTGPQSIQ